MTWFYCDQFYYLIPSRTAVEAKCISFLLLLRGHKGFCDRLQQFHTDKCSDSLSKWFVLFSPILLSLSDSKRTMAFPVFLHGRKVFYDSSWFRFSKCDPQVSIFILFGPILLFYFRKIKNIRMHSGCLNVMVEAMFVSLPCLLRRQIILHI